MAANALVHGPKEYGGIVGFQDLHLTQFFERVDAY